MEPAMGGRVQVQEQRVAAVTGDGEQAGACDLIGEPPLTAAAISAEQGASAVFAIAVTAELVEVFDEFDGAIDRLDDDPLVIGAAQRLSLDHLADEPVTGEPGDRLFERKTAADTKFHQLACAHPGCRGQHDHRGGADDADQGDGLEAVQGGVQGSTDDESGVVISAASRPKTSRATASTP
jgi:hypothetical protein